MSSICCSFCQHANPSDAKYCNECGNTLELKACDSSDACDDVHARRLHGTASSATFGKHTPTSERTAPEASASVVRALERFHADLATIRHTRSSRTTRRLLVASLVVLPGVGVFGGDEHESMRSLADLSRVMPAPVAHAAATRYAAHQQRTDSMAARTDSIAALPRSSSGAIANLPASQVASPKATITSDATRALSAGNVATTTTEPLGIRGATHRAPARVMTESTAPQPVSVPVESLPYPIGPARCTQSVAALGLCRGQDIAHAQ